MYDLSSCAADNSAHKKVGAPQYKEESFERRYKESNKEGESLNANAIAHLFRKQMRKEGRAKQRKGHKSNKETLS